MILGSGEMKVFFQERLSAALSRQGLPISATTEVYLLELLTGYVHAGSSDALARPLVEQLAAATQAETSQEQLRLYRDMGDSALYSCGFFADHLQHQKPAVALKRPLSG